MDLGNLLFSFKGRINRSRMWLGMLILFVLSIVGYVAIVASLGEPFTITNLDAVTAGNAEPEFLFNQPSLIAYGVLALISTFMSLALMAKRCHDRGKSGWWSLISLVPLAGLIWFLIDLGVMEGDEGPNQWGPNPLRIPA